MTPIIRNLLVRLPFRLLRIGLKDPLMLALMLALGGGWYAYEVRVARPAMAYQGIPETQNLRQPLHWFRVLRNPDFMVGYSDLRGGPLWVSYKIKAITARAPHPPRLRGFIRDWRTLNPVIQDDYRGSGYDRGHMAPNYAMSRLYGRQAQHDTFLMSNISPQRPNLNRKLWQRLEQVEVDYFTRSNREVWVLTGPVFKNPINRLKTAWNVEIPDAFFKIYARPNAHGTPKLLAFLMPQNARGNEPLTRYVTTVDNIEQLTGLDFFSNLDDCIENKLEAAVDAAPWQLQQVARLPTRY